MTIPIGLLILAVTIPVACAAGFLLGRFSVGFW